jgi:O-acetyl-ADP-ribose deacetylase (regulator of RNase III)
MTTIKIIKGDITKISADAIVNAANGDLRHGGGVCGMIFAAAGAKELSESCKTVIKEHGMCPTGSAVITPAHRLSNHGVKHIIHAVGPKWGEQGDAVSDELLASAYSSSLRVADAHGLTSIAFPSIATGIYHFPKDRGAKIAVATTKQYQGNLSEILLVAYHDQDERVLTHALASHV